MSITNGLSRRRLRLAIRGALRVPSAAVPALVLGLVLALLPAQAPTAAAQTSGPSPTYSFVLRGVPLNAALEQLVGTTRLDLYYDSPLVAGKRVSCVIEEAPPEDVLRCLLEGTGLDFVRLSSGTYVLVEATETAPLFGQLRGIVLDAETKEPLPNAHVMLAQATTATTSNEAGQFSFARLRPGRYLVVVTYLGYRDGTATVTVPPGGQAEAAVALESEPVLVEPVVVDGMAWRLPSTELGKAHLPRETLEETPAAGATEVLAGLGTMLGVRMNDATADIHIQGGETGEHQLRLDGAPIFLPLSFASFVGPFSPFAVGRVTVHKAGFGAAEGSQISGVIDIEHDLADARPRRLDVQMDPLTLNARASARRRTADGVEIAAMAAGRHSLWNLYAPPALEGLLDRWNRPDPFLRVAFDRVADGTVSFSETPPVGTPTIGFADLHAASRIRFGLLQSLHSSFYWGSNRLGTDIPESGLLDPPAEARDAALLAETATYRDLFAWHTAAGQSTFESVLGSRALLSVQLRGSYYRVSHTYAVPDTLYTNPDDGNRVSEVGLTTRLDYALGDRHHLEGGLEATRTHSRFAFLGTHGLPIDHRAAGWRATAFASDAFSITPFLSLDAGGRLSFVDAHGRLFAEPRAALRYDRRESPLGPWSLRLSTGLYRQFISQFDVSNRSPGALLSSTRFWLVADSTVQPPMATHYAAEWLLQPTTRWTVRLEGYYKAQQNVLAIDYASRGEAAQAGVLEQRDFVKQSRGFVAGAGLQVQRRIGAGRASARYEFSRAMRRIPEFFEGRLQRAPWDEPHRLDLAFDVRPFDRVTLLARWRGVWGRSWGFRKAYYDYLGADYTLTDEDYQLNVERQVLGYDLRHPDEHTLPPLYQLDLSLGYTLDVAGLAVQARADVLNVLDRENVAEWYLAYDPDVYWGEGEQSGMLVKENRPILPRVVSIALRATW